MKKARKKLLKLDLGCGANCHEGFMGVDLYNGAAIRCDLMKFPWPWRDESVEEVWCSHFLEHVPGVTRIKWMDELYRVLIPQGKATVIVPYWSSPRAIQDPTHQWPPLSEHSFLYFNRGWREQNKLTHYLGKCDFDYTIGYLPDPETMNRNQESQMFYVKHYLGAVNDLQIVLTKRTGDQK